MSDSSVNMQRAAKPMGKTVKWEAVEVTDPTKHVYLGPDIKGILTAREDYMDAQRAMQGKPASKIYKIRLDNGEYVSIWETAMIRDAMEEGNQGGPVPVGAIVEFHHKGKKQGRNKSSKPYHVIEVLFGIPSPSMQPARGSQSTAPAAPAPQQGFSAAPAAPAAPQAPSADNSGGW